MFLFTICLLAFHLSLEQLGQVHFMYPISMVVYMSTFFAIFNQIVEDWRYMNCILTKIDCRISFQDDLVRLVYLDRSFRSNSFKNLFSVEVELMAFFEDMVNQCGLVVVFSNVSQVRFVIADPVV